MHNHPSGHPTPSRADITMTQAIVDVAKPLGIAVHDHIIVGKGLARELEGAEADLTRHRCSAGVAVTRTGHQRRAC